MVTHSLIRSSIVGNQLDSSAPIFTVVSTSVDFYRYVTFFSPPLSVCNERSTDSNKPTIICAIQRSYVGNNTGRIIAQNQGTSALLLCTFFNNSGDYLILSSGSKSQVVSGSNTYYKSMSISVSENLTWSTCSWINYNRLSSLSSLISPLTSHLSPLSHIYQDTYDTLIYKNGCGGCGGGNSIIIAYSNIVASSGSKFIKYVPSLICSPMSIYKKKLNDGIDVLSITALKSTLAISNGITTWLQQMHMLEYGLLRVQMILVPSSIHPPESNILTKFIIKTSLGWYWHILTLLTTVAPST